MAPKISVEDHRLAIRILNGKFCAECEGRKSRTELFCSRCFKLLPEPMQRGLLDKLLWPAVLHEARKWFTKNPAPTAYKITKPE